MGIKNNGLVNSRENLHRKPEWFSHEMWGFPVNFLLNQSIDYTTHEHADGDGVLLALQHSTFVTGFHPKKVVMIHLQWVATISENHITLW